MTALSQLWLPILVSAIAIFIVSSIIHMGPFWHRSDYPAMRDQDRVMDALRPYQVQPGDYMVPRASSGAEMRSPEFMEKYNKGPVLILTVIPSGPWSIAKNMSQWFGYILLVSIFSGYVAGAAVAPGADYLRVFRFAGVAAFLSYAVALPQLSIWYHRSWSLTLKSGFDGLIYALITAGVFGTLWP
jgi:hypothetical protein